MVIQFREREKFICCNCGSELKKIEQQTLFGDINHFSDNLVEQWGCPQCNYVIKRTGLQILPYREWHRDIAGPGSTPNFKETGFQGGITWEDLDGVTSIWCDSWTPKNRFRLIEYKLGVNIELSFSQKILWQLLDSLLKKGDTENIYDGFYLINSPNINWYNAPFMIVNHKQYLMEDFKQWIKWDLKIPPFW